MNIKTIEGNKLLTSYRETIETLRKLSVPETLALIGLTDLLYASSKRKKEAGSFIYEIDLQILDTAIIPKSIVSKIDISFLLSLLRNGIRPRKVIGRAEILDYAIDKYSSFDSFSENESLLLSIIEMKGLTIDLKDIFREMS